MFWGVSLDPNEQRHLTTDRILKITRGCLVESLKQEDKRNVYLRTNGTEYCFMSFSGVSPNVMVSVVIEPNQPFCFVNKTENVVHLSGFFVEKKDPFFLEDSLVMETREYEERKKNANPVKHVEIQKKRKSERASLIAKRKSVIEPKKSVMNEPSKKTVKFGGVTQSIQIESLEDRLKKQNKYFRKLNPFF